MPISPTLKVRRTGPETPLELGADPLSAQAVSRDCAAGSRIPPVGLHSGDHSLFAVGERVAAGPGIGVEPSPRWLNACALALPAELPAEFSVGRVDQSCPVFVVVRNDVRLMLCDVVEGLTVVGMAEDRGRGGGVNVVGAG